MSGEGQSADAKARQLRQKEAELRAAADRTGRVAAAYETGAEGERKVGATLSQLESQSCRMLADRLLEPRRSKVNIDHLVVSPAGYYLIDAKNWGGNVVEHDGSLWLHKPKGGGGWRSIPMNPELDSIRRMTEKAETTAVRVIEPVLCLAGERADRFGEPRQLRGVWIVPIGSLTDWLLARPRFEPPLDAIAESDRLARIFPSAAGAEPWPMPVALVDQNEPPPQLKRTRHNASRSASKDRGKPDRKRKSAGEAIALLIGGVLMLTVGVRVLPALIQKAVMPPSPATAPAWVTPCAAISAADIQRVIGKPVYPIGPPRQDACTWSFHANPKPDESFDVLVATGWSAQAEYGATGKALTYPKDPGIAGLRIPQFVAVPGSPKPARSITQPIATGVRYGKPGIAQQQAKAAALKLAQLVAQQLPTGPGASEVRYR